MNKITIRYQNFTHYFGILTQKDAEVLKNKNHLHKSPFYKGYLFGRFPELFGACEECLDFLIINNAEPLLNYEIWVNGQKAALVQITKKAADRVNWFLKKHDYTMRFKKER